MLRSRPHFESLYKSEDLLDNYVSPKQFAQRAFDHCFYFLWLPSFSIMKATFFALAMASTAGSAYAQGQAWAQCGGEGWTGATTCVSGYTCQRQSQYYSQCVPGTAATTTTRAGTTTTTSRAGSSTPTSGSGRVQYGGTNVSEPTKPFPRIILLTSTNRSPVSTSAAPSTVPARRLVL